MKCCNCALWLPTDEDVGECMLNYVETYSCHQCKYGVCKDEN
jgi:hypothetical protein